MSVRGASRPDKDSPLCERALKMHESGLSHEAISGRLGIRPGDVSNTIKQGRKRRERLAADLARALQ